jgi:hypothetical protein
VVIYGIASGALPFRRWLDTFDQPDEPAAVALEPEQPELREEIDPKEPEAPIPAAPAEEPAAPPAALAPEAPAIAEAPIEKAPESPALAAEPAPAPKQEPPRLAALDAPAFAGPREKRLSVSGVSAGSALSWRTQRDPFLEPLSPFDAPESTQAPPPPEDSRPSLSAKKKREIETEDEPREPPRREPAPPAIATGSSCEAAIAAYNEEMDLKGGRRVADLPREAFAAVLDRGTYLSGCGVPDTMKVDICAAVQRGRAVGVTVVTRPANGRVQSCVARAVRGLRFPSHPKLDVARTRFE